MKMHLTGLVLGAVFLTQQAIAAVPAAATKIELKPEQGAVQFLAVGRPAFMKIKGEAKGPTGSVEQKDKAWIATFEFDLSTLDTGMDLRNTHMKDNYLEVGKYPKAKLVISKLNLPADWTPTKDHSGTVEFSGDLEMHGVKKPVTGTAEVKSSAAGANVIAKFALTISDFAIGVPKYAGITVADKVDVEVSLKNVK